jgi:hypothetical protein
MNRFVQCSSRVYAGVLYLYPADLRRNFGTEMTAVFTDDLADAWRSRRLAGAVEVWWRAGSEVLQIALPGRLASEALVAPAVSVLLHLAFIGAFLAIATLAREGIPPAISHGFVTLRGQ